MNYIELNNLNKSFGKINVLNNISLQVEKGEFLVLVGASGCGKSTLLRLIAGLDNPDSGSVYIDNKDVTSYPPAKRDIAMVFQNYALYPHLSVYENMAFSLKQRKVSKIDIYNKVSDTAAILKIDSLLSRRPKELSGGQRQRVALGRAMVRDPKVFLFDEPLSNLDAKLRQEMRIEIKKLHSLLDITMVYVTHDQTEAMTMGDRIAILSNGEIEQINTPENIYHNPKNKFVASFIGMPQMNFIEGKLYNKEAHIEFCNSDIKLKIHKKGNHNRLNNTSIPVILGIRPENINLLDSTEIDNSILAKVDLVENMGSFHLVHCKKGTSNFSVAIEKFDRSKKELNVKFDTNKFHFFHSESNELIF